MSLKSSIFALRFILTLTLFTQVAATYKSIAYAQAASSENPQLNESATKIETILIKNQNNKLKEEETLRVEVLNKDTIDKKQSASFSDIIDNHTGIDSQTSCAFCGAKRVSINGMKGEHTSILVDGLSLHSSVSGLYGVEAIPVEFIESIDVYRGAGASLGNPEAIGGTLYINTLSDYSERTLTNASINSTGAPNLSVLKSLPLTDKFKILTAAQYSAKSSWDVDHNGITESPQQSFKNANLKLLYSANESSKQDVRISWAETNNIGGNNSNYRTKKAPSTTATFDDFTDYDVRKKYIGSIGKISDYISTSRFELATTGTRSIDAQNSLNWGLGTAHQRQSALYSHGYDYSNEDLLTNAFVKHEWLPSEAHLISFGVDGKSQNMRSSSEYLYRQNSLKKDDLGYQSVGGHIQDTWFLSERTELAGALRFDSIKIKWIDFNKTITEQVLVPRLNLKHSHNSFWTSRFSVGTGYRAPMTLFESQHGTDHYGFEIAIDKFEKAHSYMYSLNRSDSDSAIEIGAQVTDIQNMSYGEDRAASSKPTLFRNATDTYRIVNSDLSYSQQWTDNWQTDILVESFLYPAKYKEKLPVAAVEKRLQMTLSYQKTTWKVATTATIVAERNLGAYGYEDHYNIVYEDAGLNLIAEDQKFQKAPTYMTLDIEAIYSRNQRLKWIFGITNLTDYTQTSAGDSPTTWDLHGLHYHLDNFHLWGPNEGRKFYVSLKSEF